MRLAALPLLLAAGVAVAEHPQAAPQHPLAPLEAVYEKVVSYIPEQYRPANSPFTWGANVVNDAKARVAAKNVTPLTIGNWRETLKPRKPSTGVAKNAEPDVWWVYFTGGNKTCHGLCKEADNAWNGAAARLVTVPSSPSLATIDCEQNPVLCLSWSATPPSLWHVTLPPVAGAPTDVRIIPLNATSVTTSEILDVHNKGNWKKAPLYTGIFHPFDGTLAKLQLNDVVGYVFWGLSIFPSWVYMLIISFASRSFMGRRTANAGAPAAPAPRGGAPPGDARPY